MSIRTRIINMNGFTLTSHLMGLACSAVLLLGLMQFAADTQKLVLNLSDKHALHGVAQTMQAMLSHQLMGVGHFGCLHPDSLSTLDQDSNWPRDWPLGFKIIPAHRLTGYLNALNRNPLEAQGQVLLTTGVSPLPLDNVTFTPGANYLKLADADKLKVGDSVLVTNCMTGSVHRITSVRDRAKGGVSLTLNTPLPDNADTPYTVWPLQFNVMYVKAHTLYVKALLGQQNSEAWLDAVDTLDIEAQTLNADKQKAWLMDSPKRLTFRFKLNHPRQGIVSWQNLLTV